MTAQTTTTSFPVDAPISVVLDIAAARIRCIAADRADVAVEVRPADPARAGDLQAARQIGVDFDSGVLRVRAAQPKRRILGDSGSVEVIVHLPSDSRVEATVALGELQSTGRLAGVVFEGAAGSVAIDEVTDARLILQSGDVAISRLRGPAEIRTQSGDIAVAEAHQGSVTLHTQAGRIAIDAAPGVSATLDAGTGHGRIVNTLKNADGAAAGLIIHATTAHGDITARSR